MGREFHVNRHGSVKYAVGQPMGFISSWSTFSLAHHSLVRSAFMYVGEKPIYWMLGDDVVIGSVRAKDVYLEMLDLLGVEISLPKSVISQSGRSFEFTKRTILDGIETSPVSWSTFG